MVDVSIGEGFTCVGGIWELTVLSTELKTVLKNSLLIRKSLGANRQEKIRVEIGFCIVGKFLKECFY